ncbi:hypothetical protein FSARC_6533 [Fusarium sarcochroum]|uniref:CorA-like transporter domain-containing protein n=1 Tax=Fusarium sarcochroum TaxID=1208366 RepID=A0A8H4TXB1_9HYPO|nr:hypothetical protein FSARC_6533 [Fusarium sarcochroum]
MAAQPDVYYPKLIEVPAQFIESYKLYEYYPEHLIPRSVDEQYDGDFSASYRTRFEERQKSKEPLLLRHKEVLVTQEPSNFLPSIVAVCPTQLSDKMLLRLLSYYHVMTSFLDFLFVYGIQQSQEQEIRYSGFRSDITTLNPHPGATIPSPQRSGHRYQICYNTKTVSNFGKDFKERWKWTYRQVSVYHHFDLDSGNQIWMIGDPQRSLAERIGQIYNDKKYHDKSFETYASAFCTSSRIHLVFMNAAIKDWRLIILRAEENLTTTQPIDLPKGPRGGPLFSSTDLSNLQLLERQANAALVVVESNEATLTSLRDFFHEQMTFLLSRVHSKQATPICEENLKQFLSKLGELIYETKMHIKHLTRILQSYAERKSLLFQHLEAQKMVKQEDLNNSMWALAKRGESEAITMRIVTVITLIFLPATLVSVRAPRG